MSRPRFTLDLEQDEMVRLCQVIETMVDEDPWRYDPPGRRLREKLRDLRFGTPLAPRG